MTDATAHRKDGLKVLLEEGFRFDRLDLAGIDNAPVIAVNDPDIVDQETCLFHRDVADGAAYLARLAEGVAGAMAARCPFPVVRFADGEYAFYHQNLGCNGLYRQAESRGAIRRALPLHRDALRRLAGTGILAPLVFPGNVLRRRKRGLLAVLTGDSREEPSAAGFLDFLQEGGGALTGENYIPFYAVYAYLSSAAFARLVDGRRLVLLNSDYDPTACRAWFARHGSHPEILYTEIPAEYLATRWETVRADILKRIPPGAEIALAGAGVGALPLCVDAAEHLSIPVLDAGHVLNMMNAREDKSNGMRLYTLWRKDGLAADPAGGG